MYNLFNDIWSSSITAELTSSLGADSRFPHMHVTLGEGAMVFESPMSGHSLHWILLKNRFFSPTLFHLDIHLHDPTIYLVKNDLDSEDRPNARGPVLQKHASAHAL